MCFVAHFTHIQASRAQILKKAADYVTFMKRKNQSHQQDNEDLKRQNNQLDAQSMYILPTPAPAKS